MGQAIAETFELTPAERMAAWERIAGRAERYARDDAVSEAAAHDAQKKLMDEIREDLGWLLAAAEERIARHTGITELPEAVRHVRHVAEALR